MSSLQQKLKLLFESVSSAGHILILPHNNPDPDAIASAMAVSRLLWHKALTVGAGVALVAGWCAR